MTTTTTSELATSQPTDRELLRRFSTGRDESAFRTLVARHGPLVLGVCRRVLRCEQDAEDVFQATFLAMAQKANQQTWHESVAGWLYKVAYHTSLKVRAKSAKRRETELKAEVMSTEPQPDAMCLENFVLDESALDTNSLRAVSEQNAEQTLHEEILRLPQQYREPILLCHLEGKTREEAARELRVSETAVKGRLQRGRQMLLLQLGLRGVAFSVGFAAVQRSLSAAEVSLSDTLLGDSLLDAATQAGMSFINGESNAATSQIIQISEGNVNTMIQGSLLKKALVYSFSLAVLWGGTICVLGAAYGQLPTGQTALSTAAPSDAEAKSKFADPSEPLVFAMAAPEISASSDAKLPEAAAERIAKALREDAQFEFVDTPLRDVFAFLSEKHGIKIQVDKRALDDEGFTVDEGVTINIKGISLKSALNLLLDPLQLAHITKHEVLLITTKTEAELDVYAKTYDVTDLLRTDPKQAEVDLDELMESLTQVVERHSWDKTGGPGTMTKFRGNLLLISQSQVVHEKIADFLKDLRANIHRDN